MPKEHRLFPARDEQRLFAAHDPAPWAPPRAPIHLARPTAPGPLLRLGDPTPLLAVASSAALAASAYVVQPGDTLSEIAAQHGVAAEQIAEASGVTDLNLIYAGQELTLPAAAPDPDGDASGPVTELAPPATAHRVAAGETLWSIARDHDTTVEELAAANGIADPDRIVAGTELAVPTPGGDQPSPPGSSLPRPAPSHPATHVVSPGETLSGIADRYGVALGDLAVENGIADPDHLVAGTELIIPGAWRCPVPGASFVDDFGYVKPDGRTHEGIDLHAPRGTPVYAPAGGNLEQVEGDRGGKQFYLHADDGRLYIGTHLDAFGASGAVTAGDVIGSVGTTGNAQNTSPHLHFEIHEDGAPINPFEDLAACR